MLIGDMQIINCPVWFAQDANKACDGSACVCLMSYGAAAAPATVAPADTAQQNYPHSHHPATRCR